MSRRQGIMKILDPSYPGIVINLIPFDFFRCLSLDNKLYSHTVNNYINIMPSLNIKQLQKKHYGNLERKINLLMVGKQQLS